VILLIACLGVLKKIDGSRENGSFSPFSVPVLTAIEYLKINIFVIVIVITIMSNQESLELLGYLLDTDQKQFILPSLKR
jgi:hypothetical protein